MMKFQIPFEMSMDIVKARREIVDPNEGFIQKLKDFEEKISENEENHFPSSK